MLLAHPLTQPSLPWRPTQAAEETRPTMCDRHADPRQWFEARLEPLLDRLYGTALRLTRHPDDAEDIVAEAVSKAWHHLDELRDPARFDAWLFHILSNTFISEWRRRQCRPQPANDPDAVERLAGDDFTLFQQLHQPFLLWWGSLEEQFFNQLLQEDLERAVDALPDPFRVVMVLVEVQGYTYEEVARLLGIPLGTVRSRLSRARSLLQKRLWQQARDAGIAPTSPGQGGTRP